MSLWNSTSCPFAGLRGKYELVGVLFVVEGLLWFYFAVEAALWVFVENSHHGLEVGLLVEIGQDVAT